MNAIVQATKHVLGSRPGNVALHEPEFRGNEWTYVKDCLDSGWVSSVGAYVDRFEDMLRELTGAEYAIATANGTAALHVCLDLAGVRGGDEVLVPALTFIATANAVSYTAARPHFVDSESHTLGVDPCKLDAYLHEAAELRDGTCINKATGAPIRALVVMHAFGHAVDLPAVLAVCSRWNIVLIEDAAESLGSTYAGRHTGTFGRLAALSFNGNKVVTTGGGGAILTNDPILGPLAKHVTTTARVAHRWSFIHDRIGYNYRLPNLNAAVGCAQLERLPDLIARKRRLAERYIEAFSGVVGVHIAREPTECCSNYWLVALVLDEPDESVRDAILRALNDAGIMARPAWTLMHKLPMYRECPRMDLRQAETLEKSIINLPSSPWLVT